MNALLKLTAKKGNDFTMVYYHGKMFD